MQKLSMDLTSMYRKQNIYLPEESIIRLIIIYGCETWVLTQNMTNYINAIERKILRCIFGSKQEDETWKLRYSHEVYEIFKLFSISGKKVPGKSDKRGRKTYLKLL